MDTQPEQSYSSESVAEARLKNFVSRATRGKGLPSELLPDKEEDMPVFADLLIEHFTADVAEMRGEDSTFHTRALARAAFTRAYLEGEARDELVARLRKSGISQKEGYEEYALKVAGFGAKAIKKKLAANDKANSDSTTVAPVKLEITRAGERLPILDEYVDLADTIKRLYQEKRALFTDRYASELLLFFGLAHDPDASDELIKQSLINAAGHLYFDATKMRKKQDSSDDKHLEQGLDYILTVAEHHKRTSLQTLIQYEMRRGIDTEEDAQKYVYSHIAYTLDMLYPQR